ncbi:MAG: DUF748 domain-containing protein [Desulfobulbus sp.]|jgi:hypothetical protein|nr:DUF748 domain-containing protein [Desulfobulbus sp.]
MNTHLQIMRVRIAAFFRKTWVRVLIVLALCIVLFILLLPVGLQKGLQYWLLKNGADTAQVGKFAANLFTGRFAIHGMEVDREGKNVLSDSLLALDLNLGALFRKKVLVQRAVYEKATIDIEQLADGRWRYTSYLTKPSSDMVEVAESKSASSPWTVLVNEMRPTDCVVRLKPPDLQLTLAIDSAALDGFDTAPGAEGASFHFKGRVNDAPLEVHLDRLQVLPHLNLNGSLSLADFDLGRLATLLAPTVQPFTGTVGVDGRLHLSLPAEGPRAEYEGRLDLTGVDVGIVETALTEQNLVWQGTASLTGRETGDTVKVDGTLEAQDLAIDLPQSSILFKTGTFQLKGPLEFTFGKRFSLSSEAALSLDTATLSMPAGALAIETTGWAGKLTCAAGATAEAPMKIVTNGSWKTGGLTFTQPEPGLSVRQGETLLEGRSETTLGKQLQAGFDGHLGLADLDLRLPDLTVAEKALSWQGAIGYNDANQPTVSLNGALDGQGLTLALSADGGEPLLSMEQFAASGIEATTGQRFTVQRVQSKGIALRVDSDLPLTLQVPEVVVASVTSTDWQAFSAGSVTVHNTRAVPQNGQGEFGALAELAIDRLQYVGDGQVSAASVQLADLQLLPDATGAMDQGALRLGQARLTAPVCSADKGLGAESLVFADFFAQLVREKNGGLRANKQLAAMRSATSTKTGETAKPAAQQAPATSSVGGSAAGEVAIKTVSLEGKSGLQIEDHSLAQPFLSDIKIKRFVITDLSTSPTGTPATIDLAAVLDERSPLTIKGTMTPFAKAPGVDAAVSLKNYPLSRLSPYVIQSVGLALTSGQLNLATTVKVADGTMRMKNGIHLKKLETATISKELASQLDNRLPLPLGSAISFLKDSNGDLKLDIPIQGPLAELNVGIADLLITALGKAIVPAASSYLMYALGPYGALAYVGMKVGENIMKASLAPVIFPVGENELTTEHRTYLEQVAKVLKDRPKMELNLCPATPAWELLSKKERAKAGDKNVPLDELDRTQLNRLGQERAQAILARLTNAHGIDQARLMICETKILTKRDARPVVELQL